MAADRGTDRKVVSVLFCDLVGVTSHWEKADPEDVLEDAYVSLHLLGAGSYAKDR